MRRLNVLSWHMHGSYLHGSYPHYLAHVLHAS